MLVCASRSPRPNVNLHEAEEHRARLRLELDRRPTTEELDTANRRVAELAGQIQVLRKELDERPSDPDLIMDLVRAELDPMLAPYRGSGTGLGSSTKGTVDDGRTGKTGAAVNGSTQADPTAAQQAAAGPAKADNKPAQTP